MKNICYDNASEHEGDRANLNLTIATDKHHIYNNVKL